jgi:hypothetical protein
MGKYVKRIADPMNLIFKEKTPRPTPPPTMPDSQSPAVLAARRKAMARQMGSTGRESTLLSGGSGGVFGSETLG